jgi:hypothetical protein
MKHVNPWALAAIAAIALTCAGCPGNDAGGGDPKSITVTGIIGHSGIAAIAISAGTTGTPVATGTGTITGNTLTVALTAGTTGTSAWTGSGSYIIGLTFLVDDEPSDFYAYTNGQTLEQLGISSTEDLHTKLPPFAISAAVSTLAFSTFTLVPAEIINSPTDPEAKSITVTGITGHSGTAAIALFDSTLSAIVAQGSGTISGGSVTAALKTATGTGAGSDWTGSGSYFMQMVIQTGNQAYLYTNGQTLAELGTSNPPQFTISQAVSTVDFSKFVAWSNESAPEVTGNTIVHENPAITAALDTEGNKVTINADGSATLTGGGISYAFPSGLSLEWDDCTTIKIEYTLSNDQTSHAGAIIKDGVDSSTDITTSNNEKKYPWLTNAVFLSLDVAFFQNTTNPGVTIQYNESDNGGNPFTIKITKVTFEKIDEVFAPGTPSVVGGRLEHPHPRISAGNNATYNTGDGSVTMSGNSSLVYYAFPTGWNSYNTITIEYIATKISGEFIQGNIKDGANSWDSIGGASGNDDKYPVWIQGGSGGTYTTRLAYFTKSVDGTAATPGISIQNNSGDCTLKITKISFSTVTE